jgi:type 1 glutamine amidotransferase
MEHMNRPTLVKLFTGGHPFDQTSFQGFLDSLSDIDLSIMEQPHGSESLADEHQPLPQVLWFYDFAQQFSTKSQQRLKSAISQGMGLVVMHHAIYNHLEWTDYPHLIGGYYSMSRCEFNGVEIGPSTSVMADMQVQILDRKHPITAGLTNFDLHDECYHQYYVSADIHPLLGTSHPMSHPFLAWTRSLGLGRIVYLQSGHGPSAFENQSFRIIVNRALLWAGESSPNRG